jgi:hypothetical protein
VGALIGDSTELSIAGSKQYDRRAGNFNADDAIRRQGPAAQARISVRMGQVSSQLTHPISTLKFYEADSFRNITRISELFLTRSYSTKPCVAFEAVLRRR